MWNWNCVIHSWETTNTSYVFLQLAYHRPRRFKHKQRQRRSGPTDAMLRELAKKWMHKQSTANFRNQHYQMWASGPPMSELSTNFRAKLIDFMHFCEIQQSDFCRIHDKCEQNGGYLGQFFSCFFQFSGGRLRANRKIKNWTILYKIENQIWLDIFI